MGAKELQQSFSIFALKGRLFLVQHIKFFILA